MRIIYFGNNRVGLACLRHLLDDGVELAALAVHPPERARLRQEILDVAGLPDDRIFEGADVGDPEVVKTVASLEPDLGVCALYDWLFPPDMIRACARGIVNLHPSFLPWNRGQFPNVWSILEGTPSGVTLHWVDEGVDTGDVIARSEVLVEPVDTGATLYRKLESAAVTLFEETWPLIRDGTASRRHQNSRGGTYHRKADVEAVDRIDLDAPTTARALLDLIRARTFRPYESAWFETEDGRKVQVRVSLEYGGGENDRERSRGQAGATGSGGAADPDPLAGSGSGRDGP